MKLDTSKYDQRGLYKEDCEECGKTHVIRTQKDNDPEYYTHVYVECSCGDWVEFKLPVN